MDRLWRSRIGHDQPSWLLAFRIHIDRAGPGAYRPIAPLAAFAALWCRPPLPDLMAGADHPSAAGRFHHLWHAIGVGLKRSEEHTFELQSLMRISYAGFCYSQNNLRFY